MFIDILRAYSSISMWKDGQIRLLQDNSPVHTAAVVKNSFWNIPKYKF